MAITPFGFTPTQGLRDSTAYPTNPGSEAAARAQVQTGMDQLRDYINGQLATDLNNTYAQKIALGANPWIAPTLLNGWINFGGFNAPAGYFKDQLGNVHIRAVIKGGTFGSPAWVLPAGYRPRNDFIEVVNSNDAFGSMVIQSSGNVQPNLGNATYFSFYRIFLGEL